MANLKNVLLFCAFMLFNLCPASLFKNIELIKKFRKMPTSSQYYELLIQNYKNQHPTVKKTDPNGKCEPTIVQTPYLGGYSGTEFNDYIPKVKKLAQFINFRGFDIGIINRGKVKLLLGLNGKYYNTKLKRNFDGPHHGLFKHYEVEKKSFMLDDDEKLTKIKFWVDEEAHFVMAAQFITNKRKSEIYGILAKMYKEYEFDFKGKEIIALNGSMNWALSGLRIHSYQVVCDGNQ